MGIYIYTYIYVRLYFTYIYISYHTMFNTYQIHYEHIYIHLHEHLYEHLARSASACGAPALAQVQLFDAQPSRLKDVFAKMSVQVSVKVSV